MQQRLLEMGHWLKVNGEAIYGTRFAGRDCQWSEGEKPKQEYGQYKVKYDIMEQIGKAAKNGKASKQLFFTRKPEALYAITTGWLAPSVRIKKVSLPADATVTMLGIGKPLKFEVQGDDLVIEVPTLMPDEMPCRDNFVFKLPGARFL